MRAAEGTMKDELESGVFEMDLGERAGKKLSSAVIDVDLDEQGAAGWINGSRRCGQGCPGKFFRGVRRR
jgi:hypothetical protein